MLLSKANRSRSRGTGADASLPAPAADEERHAIKVTSAPARPGTLSVVARAVLPLLIVGGSLIVTDLLVSSKPEVARGKRDETAYPIETIVARRGDHRPTLHLFGEIVPARVAELRAISAGEVVAQHPDLAVGGHVEKGDVLVRVDDFPYRGALTEAEANIAEAKARIAEADARLDQQRTAAEAAAEQLDLAERDLARARQLKQTGNISEQAIDARRLLVSQREQAADEIAHTIAAEEARLAQQRAALDRLVWQRDRAARALEDTVLKAPFDGVVMSESVEIGRLLNANDIVVTLYEDNALDARFQISDLQYGRLAASGETIEGTDVAVIWSIGDEPMRYRAVIRRIGAEIAAARGGVDVFARLQLGASPVSPRPGAFVAVDVPGLLRRDTIRVPATAIFKDHLYVVADGRLERRRAELLARDGKNAIVAADVADGERVMVTRLGEAGDGVRVFDVTAGEPVDGTIAEIKRGRRS